ncbi:MAG TPA: DUF167 domain-containing protein [Acidimicrobiales bacterium]|nr:DUF167 domain-containing protein [Acidimicrobiales bacterium]
MPADRSNIGGLFEVSGDDVVVHVHVQPGAGRTAVTGRHGNALKVKVGAPPQGGRANEAVLALLAEVLGAPVASLSLDGGATSRAKRVRVRGVAPADVERRLELAMAGNAGGGRGVLRRAP